MVSSFGQHIAQVLDPSTVGVAGAHDIEPGLDDPAPVRDAVLLFGQRRPIGAEVANRQVIESGVALRRAAGAWAASALSAGAHDGPDLSLGRCALAWLSDVFAAQCASAGVAGGLRACHPDRSMPGGASTLGSVPAPLAEPRKPAGRRRALDPTRRRRSFDDESPTALVRRARAINRALTDLYPDAHCELDFATPLQLVVATILSAQCTDKRVNLITPALFKRYPTAADFAAAEPAELEALIRSAGFYRAKAKSISEMAKMVVAEFGGKVPQTMEELLT